MIAYILTNRTRYVDGVWWCELAEYHQTHQLTITDAIDHNSLPEIPTSPNIMVVRVECDAATLAAIEADERFCVLEVEE